MKIGNIKLSRPDGTKEYIGAVIKTETSFPGNGMLLLGVPKGGSDGGFDRVTGLVLESGEVVTLEGYVNISAKL